jgi:TolB protein
MIAFHSDRDGDRETYVMHTDGKNQRNLTNNPAYDGDPAWSPDGQKIAFNSDRDGDSEIYVMNADGKDLRRLTDHPAEDWVPDWFDPAFAYSVSPAGKLKGTWGWIKQNNE